MYRARRVNPNAWVAVAAIVGSVILSLASFWHARLLAKQQRLGAQRDDLYIDLLTEANAEREWHLLQVENNLGRPERPDTRLEPRDRARLASRANIFAEPHVLNAWQHFERGLSVVAVINHHDLAGFRAQLDEAVYKLASMLRQSAQVDPKLAKLARRKG